MELSYRKGGAHLKSTGSKFALIPAYMPAQPMLQTARELTNHGFSVVIVNDGSPSSFDSVFRNAETFATVITLPENQGKGEALKEGLRFLRDNVVPPYIVVTVDADGQHRIDDVLRVYACAEKHPDDLVLGSRELQKDAPLKSKIGNNITNFLHRVTTGMRLTDTQTGLRAFSDRSIDRIIRSGGSRYEYEMYMLLRQQQRVALPAVQGFRTDLQGFFSLRLCAERGEIQQKEIIHTKRNSCHYRDRIFALFLCRLNGRNQNPLDLQAVRKHRGCHFTIQIIGFFQYMQPIFRFCRLF